MTSKPDARAGRLWMRCGQGVALGLERVNLLVHHVQFVTHGLALFLERQQFLIRGQPPALRAVRVQGQGESPVP